jgi:hypothetical protein
MCCDDQKKNMDEELKSFEKWIDEAVIINDGINIRIVHPSQSNFGIPSHQGKIRWRGYRKDI